MKGRYAIANLLSHPFILTENLMSNSFPETTTRQRFLTISASCFKREFLHGAYNKKSLWHCRVFESKKIRPLQGLAWQQHQRRRCRIFNNEILCLFDVSLRYVPSSHLAIFFYLLLNTRKILTRRHHHCVFGKNEKGEERV